MWMKSEYWLLRASITKTNIASDMVFRILSDSKIQIKGSAFNGIQIMGLLESRVLDFENVIVTNLNEGILPLGKNDFSFLPFELKKNYEIPTFHENDLIYTYHFYRLLHRPRQRKVVDGRVRCQPRAPSEL